MKLILKGTPEELSKILALVAISELTNKIEGELKEQGAVPFTPPDLVQGTGGPGSGPGEGHPTGAPSEKRTRRTKEQIEADKLKDAQVQAPAPISTPAAQENNGEITMEVLKEFVLEKSQDHGPKIRTKLNEYGAKKTGDLKPEFWNPFYIFLQAL